MEMEKTMKKEKRFLILLLANIIFMVQGIVDTAYAHSTKDDNNLRLTLYKEGIIDSYPKTLRLSNMPENNTVYEIENRIFKLKNIPHINDYNYLWIQYEPINHLGNTIDTDIVSISWGNTYPIQLEIPQLATGQYYANIRLVDEEWESEKDLTWRNLLINVNGNDIDFTVSPTYAHNKQAILSRKTRNTKALTHKYKNNEEIKKLALAIIKDKKSDYEKVKAVHDWVCENIYYNWDDFTSDDYSESQKAIDVLYSKRAVCQGYAELTAALIESLGIPCHIITGYALGAGTEGKWHTDNIVTQEINHAWNEAFVDGKWIILDTTWDSSNLYKNGQYSINTGLKGYTYFDPTLEAFSATHKIIR